MTQPSGAPSRRPPNRYTDRNLLAAVDLGATPSGAIAMSRKVNPPTAPSCIRTFLVAATVTLATCLIGLPYAMLVASLDGMEAGS